MKEFDFTNGEWEIVSFSDDSFAIKSKFGEKAYQYELVAERIENKDNARLIACAPEMLNIIIKIAKELYEYNPTDKGKKYMLEFISIIEKATGKKWEEICK